MEILKQVWEKILLYRVLEMTYLQDNEATTLLLHNSMSYAMMWYNWKYVSGLQNKKAGRLHRSCRRHARLQVPGDSLARLRSLFWVHGQARPQEEASTWLGSPQTCHLVKFISLLITILAVWKKIFSIQVCELCMQPVELVINFHECACCEMQ